MNTTKSPEEQTAEEAPLNDVNELLNQLAPHWRTIAGVAAVLVTGIVIFGVISGNRKSAEGSSWASFFEAAGNQDAASLQAVAENSSGNVVPWAQQAAAQAKLIEASQNLYTDRDLAKTGFEEAIAGFTTAVARSENIALLNQRSLWGLGQAHEGANDLEQAKATYQKLADRWPDSAFADRAKERVVSLDDPQTQEFYEWFFAQAPPTQSAFGDSPSLPFDVPDSPDVTIPSVGDTPSSESTSVTPITDALSGSSSGTLDNPILETTATEGAVEEPVVEATTTDETVPTGEVVTEGEVIGEPVEATVVEGEVVVEAPAAPVVGVPAVETPVVEAPVEPIPAGEVPKPPH